MEEPSPRLNKYLALQLGVSRREADELIRDGVVRINDTQPELGVRFHEGDQVTVNGKQVSGDVTHIYLALNKPINYVCSRKQQGESPTIYSLLPSEYQSLKSVGRLDRNSSGLILLTNDGDFAFRMTHPKFAKTKVYTVQLDHDLAPLHQQMVSDHGIQLEDGPSQLSLGRIRDDSRRDWQVTMSEGRNRQIRRTFQALGYEVITLHRTHFGPYSLERLQPGEYRLVTS